MSWFEDFIGGFTGNKPAAAPATPARNSLNNPAFYGRSPAQQGLAAGLPAGAPQQNSYSESPQPSLPHSTVAGVEAVAWHRQYPPSSKLLHNLRLW